jgi:hypothetical protein
MNSARAYVAAAAIGVMFHLPIAASAATSAVKRTVPSRPETTDAATALALCQRADQLAGKEKERVLARGLEMAEQAVAATPRDAQAHFAIFCNLGKQMQSREIGPGDLVQIRRLHEAVDTALELAPGYTEALIAKGAMLLRLPMLLGGDEREGKALLRQALAQDPSNVEARRYLAEVKAR